MKADPGIRDSFDSYYIPGALGVLGIGGLLGGMITFRNQKTPKSALRNPNAVAVASKALFIATVLSCGTFGLASSLFVYVTGVNSFRELLFWGNYQFSKFDFIAKNKRMKRLIEEEEMKKYGAKSEDEYLEILYDELFTNDLNSKESNLSMSGKHDSINDNERK